ncbi:glycerophosphodiester phosphodiesterase [Dethiosulfatarculus sandiegensis]|uniref:GP-PDE domain-containing protein n=1 Tax=Dethiosulfatarculus sandiegensis TaxID=1429043 RepID=A0A0D2JT41_9BACT|nr:glycerophosphodiester phosphodiesterase family protein [Dethiosulfatarculus sandiegensis]KIX12645.1 hypothetical protein X474_18030 [Dethiosulfatarculus sandiegensis]
MSFFDYVAKLRNKGVKTLCGAHRGGLSLAPENTLAAAGKAFSTGAHFWELDVRLSKDGVPMVIHDRSLERTTNAWELRPKERPWNVDEYTWQELMNFNCGWEGLKIPPLAQALSFTREKNQLVNVEIKDLRGLEFDFDVCEKVIEVIHGTNMIDRVLISSFNHEYVAMIKEIEPLIPTGALIKEPVEDPIKLLTALKANALHPHFSLVHSLPLKEMRKNGFEIMAWTVNDTKIMQAMIDARVGGIITDYPQDLMELMEKN